MMPYLRTCEKRRPHSFYSLLREYLVAMAADDLTLPVLLFKASKADVSSFLFLLCLKSIYNKENVAA